MKMTELIDSLLLKNRTIVSSDFEECLVLMGGEIPLDIHRYPSGSDYQTWLIPPQWDVKKAELFEGDRIIASYDDHPLFLAPYSCSFTGWVSREELLSHVKTSPERPDTLVYEYRLAANFQRRLKTWLISLPYTLVQELDQAEYYIDIEVETKPGHMLIAEGMIKGRHDYTFTFLTHLCHTGQANDGLAGVAVGIEVMKRLQQEYPQTNYNYQLLIMPETFGSSVYLASNEERIESYLGSVFIEMPGIRSPIRLGLTRRGDTYLDRVLNHVTSARGIKFTECEFREHWGNDELVFDSPGIGIPGASIERYPFHWYHTSRDNLEETEDSSLQEVVDILMDAVRLIESDFIPQPRHGVPVYLTRYDLYADWEYERSQYDINIGVLELLWSGKSAFDIAKQVNAPYDAVRNYLEKLMEHDLIETAPLTPAYFRNGSEARD